MDIKQPLDARAFVTIGKDMTFRDFAQGCWRMRGLGKGQSVHVLITRGVEKLIRSSKQKEFVEASPRLASNSAVIPSLLSGESIGDATTGSDFPIPSNNNLKLISKRERLSPLTRLCGWLMINTLKSERMQYTQLYQQNLSAIWRKLALQNMLASFTPVENHIEV
jgi:hypothetical protein